MDYSPNHERIVAMMFLMNSKIIAIKPLSGIGIGVVIGVGIEEDDGGGGGILLLPALDDDGDGGILLLPALDDDDGKPLPVEIGSVLFPEGIADELGAVGGGAVKVEPAEPPPDGGGHTTRLSVERRATKLIANRSFILNNFFFLWNFIYFFFVKNEY